MPARYVDRLTPLARAGDLAQALVLAESLSADERKEAAEWLANCRRWLSRMQGEFGNARTDESREIWATLPWIIAVNAVQVCGPATAAKVVPWSEFWGYRKDRGEVELTRLLIAKPRDWALTFLQSTTDATLTNSGWSGEVLSRVVRAVGRHHQAPCPTGGPFYDHWLAGCPEKDIVEQVANDPWMPELLEHYLDVGGTNTWVLENLPEWISRGVTSRERLLTTCFAQLTTPRRPSSQNALAKILASLDFQAGEVPGGLNYLLGVIATVAGPAGKILLPKAIELVNDDSQAEQLAAVITARTEKAQRSMLLTALTKTWTGRVSEPTIIAALTQLAEDPDTVFAEKVRAQLAKLAPTAPPPTSEPAPALGLWELSPTPATAEEKKRFAEKSWLQWPEFLTESGRPKEIDQAKFVDILLTAAANDDAEQLDAFRRMVRRLMDSQQLTLSRVTNMLPDLFVGGGMKAIWPIALNIADYASWRVTVPPTLADLLRQLTSFAADAPHQPLPYNLAAFASRAGTTKAQVEARVLAEALGHAGGALADPIISGGNLWRDDPSTVPQPENQTLLVRDWDVDTLVAIASTHRSGWQANPYPIELLAPEDPQRRKPHFWVLEQVIASTVRRLHEGSGEALRAGLAQVRRHDSFDEAWTAISLWANRRLDVERYWRLTAGVQRLTSFDWAPLAPHTYLFEDPSEDRGTLYGSLGNEHSHLALLRACEALLLADRQKVVLAEPIYADGTLELRHLLARLEEGGEAPFGPLDALQALYRLRDVDPTDVGKIPSGRWFTAPELTSRDGSAPPMDIGELLRTWIAGGGLPPLQAQRANQWTWEFEAKPPLAWSVCAAAPAGLSQTPWRGGGRVALRTVPGWVDLTEGFHDGARGPLGPRWHEALIRDVADTARTGEVWLRARVLNQFRAQRIDTDLFVTASLGCSSVLTSLFIELFEAGAMVQAWPVAVASAVAMCADRSNPPPAEVVRLLVRYSGHVPFPRATDDQLDALRAIVTTADPDGADSAKHARVAQELLHVLDPA